MCISVLGLGDQWTAPRDPAQVIEAGTAAFDNKRKDKKGHVGD